MVRSYFLSPRLSVEVIFVYKPFVMAYVVHLEDRLEGASNFNSWKVGILFILEDNELESHLKDQPEEIFDTNKYNKSERRAKRIIIDSVKYHLIPHISRLESAKKMFDTLIELFESKNSSRMLTLRNQLHCISMSSSDTINSYLMKISQLRDHLVAIEDPVNDKELVSITLNGLPTSWDPFIQGVCARDKLPSFDKLWADYVHEESRLISRNNLRRPVDNLEQPLLHILRKVRNLKEGTHIDFLAPLKNKEQGKEKMCPQCSASDVTSLEIMPGTVLKERINMLHMQMKNLHRRRRSCRMLLPMMK